MFIFICTLLTVSCIANGQYRGGLRDYSTYESNPQPSAGASQELYSRQHYQPQSQPQPEYQPTSYKPSQPIQPPPAILMHKQQLTHDGGFNFVYTAENGLKHGESIAPDGTRQGAYQYVDPNGKTISVKYTAGKEGFKILEGPVPQPHPAIAQQIAQPTPQPRYQQAQYQQPQYQQPQYQSSFQTPYKPYQPQYPRYTIGSEQQEDDGQYRGEGAYESQGGSSHYTVGGPQTFAPVTQAKYVQPRPTIPAPIQQYRPNAIQRDEVRDDYSVEPGKPHSFGNGYSFEFAG